MTDIDIEQLADNAPIGRFHISLLIWCALIIAFEGYDLSIVGVAMPLIMKDLHVTAAQAGFMASAALIGMSLGAIVLGTLSARLGSRRIIAIGVVIFSAFTAAAGLASSPAMFGALRFLAGFGIGGVMPCVIALITEYSPKRLRGTLVTAMMCGYAVGGILVALLGKMTIAQYGWQTLFYAALTPIILIPFILRSLPESMGFLVQNERLGPLRTIACELGSADGAQAAQSFSLPQSHNSKVPVDQLFTHRRGLGTLMLWIAYFMALFMIYALSAWLPKLMTDAGQSLSSAMVAVMLLNLGSIFGALGGGWLADRWFSLKSVLLVMCFIAFISIFSLGQYLPLAWLYVSVTLAGATTIGTQTVTHVCTGQFYPTALRSTGLGWALGMGRIGAIIGPILIGLLTSWALKLQWNFLVIALPSVIAALAVSLVDLKSKVQKTTSSGTLSHTAQ